MHNPKEDISDTIIPMRHNKIDMVNGPLLKNIFIFSLPLMATNLLQMLFNAVDTIVVGKFAGELPLAAVGATGSIIYLWTSLFQGLAVGTNVLVARYLGAKNDEGASKACYSAITMGLFCGVAMSIAGVFVARPILLLMDTPADILDLSTTYLRIYLFGSFSLITYNFASGILRAKGDTKRPMNYLIVAGIVNAILNVIFVVFFKLSVLGVAVATVISSTLSMLLIMRALLSETDCTRIELDKLHIDKDSVKEILRIGVPSGIQGMAFSFTNMIVQSAINSFDSSTIVAGNTAAINIENFIYIGMMAFSSAAITFTSQSLGAGRKERILKIMFITMLLDCGSALLIGSLAYRFGGTLLLLYTDEAPVVAIGMKRLFWIGMFLALNGMLDILGNSMCGMGHSTLPAVIMLSGIIVTRMLWLKFVFPVYNTIDVIYMCFPISWLVTTLIDMVAYFFVYRKVVLYN